MKIQTIKKILNNQSKTSLNAEGKDLTLRKYYRDLALDAQKYVNVWSPHFSDNDAHDGVFQVIDMFCGCGGMTLGFAAMGKAINSFEIVGGCDIDKSAAASFEHNFEAPGIVQDIVELGKNNKKLNNFLKNLDRYNPDKPLILIGCAPCQGFTSHRKKNWQNDDSRNTLVGVFAAIASKLNPACVVMENVPEFLSKKYFMHFLETKQLLIKAGYIVHQSIYNAAAFNVPQERFRSLLIAMKKEFLLPRLLSEQSEYKTVFDAIGHLPPINAGERHSDDFYHRSANHRESTLKVIKAIPKNGGSRPKGVGPVCLDRIRGFFDVYGRLHWERPSITITHYARNPASGRFTHPEQDRGLTMREAALLQSFPMGFEFKGTFDSIFKQIGEAVPPLFAAAIAANTFIELVSNEPTNLEINESIPSIEKPVSNSFSSVIAGIKQSGTANGVYSN